MIRHFKGGSDLLLRCGYARSMHPIPNQRLLPLGISVGIIVSIHGLVLLFNRWLINCSRHVMYSAFVRQKHNTIADNMFDEREALKRSR